MLCAWCSGQTACDDTSVLPMRSIRIIAWRTVDQAHDHHALKKILQYYNINRGISIHAFAFGIAEKRIRQSKMCAPKIKKKADPMTKAHNRNRKTEMSIRIQTKNVNLMKRNTRNSVLIESSITVIWLILRILSLLAISIGQLSALQFCRTNCSEFFHLLD